MRIHLRASVFSLNLCVGLHVRSPGICVIILKCERVCVCVCANYFAYHPAAHLNCQALWGRLICIAAVPLKNHNKISHECILGARRVYHRCPVSSGYTWNIWVEHVDNLSGPTARFSLWLCSKSWTPFLCFPDLFFLQSPHKCSSFVHIWGLDESDGRGVEAS